ncbi:kinase-like protein [Fomitiporia mediterranea MF3/22]|uniref:kinase-like protein n=1 Tax=Fomitiporia mediterranea (strain MF3/22) TaxID=694068 RepID=UPI00044079FE|nr:kinase-like protein [Fomitiporia mediterranea MF3/22]EJC99226.1 kinase-like protein [Fomitiporia mediterranea MF3/22]
MQSRPAISPSSSWRSGLGHLQDSHAEPGDVLRRTLVKLAHLDLTRHVKYDSAVMKAHGGYCDVFVGTANIPVSEKDRDFVPAAGSAEQRHLVKVAIKRLRVHIQTERVFARRLAKELAIWSKLDHTNILPLLGYVMEGDYPSVVSEWIENGTVGTYLKANPNADPVPLIVGIANGLNYLHRNDIVHSDVKADNVLVDHTGKPLICDFGISRVLSSALSITGTSTGGLRGSIRWMARELLDVPGDIRHTKETDVWAFGMTVYEILTGEFPFAHLKLDVFVVLAVMRGELPVRPPAFVEWSETLQSIWSVCEKCWVSSPGNRVTMENIVVMLKENVVESDSDTVVEAERAEILPRETVTESQKITRIRPSGISLAREKMMMQQPFRLSGSPPFKPEPIDLTRTSSAPRLSSCSSSPLSGPCSYNSYYTAPSTTPV